MAERRRASPKVIAGFTAFGAFAVAVIASLPMERCVRRQEQALLDGAYKFVPDRAEDSARIMCERKASLRDRSFFSSFTKF